MSEGYSKSCYKCDAVVRMSGPEFARSTQWWTTCDRCRALVATEAKFVGEPIEKAKPEEAA